jgi:spermidine/putrescine transport system ATP-binding protein
MAQMVTKGKIATARNLIADVELQKVFKNFGGETVVRGIDLRIERGEFFSILGPSGCGKTTTLRIIAGFEQPTAGDVLIRGRSMIDVPPYNRPVNTVFQSYALFNHLTVRENIAFGLRIQKLNKTELQQRVSEVLRLVKMTEFASRYPAQLSGGQQQRVALARALVNRPAVVLLDEPLGALDLKLRKEMQVELVNLQRQLGLTFVLVTHDQEEALSLSDRIAVMHQGKIEQIGTPSQIYNHPQSKFVAEFIGDTNLWHGRVEGSHPERVWVTTRSGLQLTVRSTGEGRIISGAVVVSVRPEHVQILAAAAAGKENCFEGRLENVMYLGSHRHCLIKLRSGDSVVVQQSNDQPRPESGAVVYVYWPEAAAIILPDEVQ